MARAGYDETSSIIATAVTCAVGSILSSFITDMPFIIAPPTSVSIFLAVSSQQQGLSVKHSNSAVVWSGVALTVIGAVPPITRFVTRVIIIYNTYLKKKNDILAFLTCMTFYQSF